MDVLSPSFLQGCRPLGRLLLELAGPMDERARFRCKEAGGRRTSRRDGQRCSIKYGVMRRSLTQARVRLYLQKNDKIVRI